MLRGGMRAGVSRKAKSNRIFYAALNFFGLWHPSKEKSRGHREKEAGKFR
jgi:hypothetical protein